MCWLSGLGACVFFFFFLGGGPHVKMLFGCRAASLRPCSFSRLLLPLVPSQRTKQMEPGHGNDKKMH